MMTVLLLLCFVDACADIKHAPVIRVDQKQGLSCMAADEEDLQLLMEHDGSAQVLAPEPVRVEAGRVPTLEQAPKASEKLYAAEVSPPMQQKKKPRLLRVDPMKATYQPVEASPPKQLRPAMVSKVVRGKRRRAPDAWIALKAKEQQVLQDVSGLNAQDLEFLRLAKEVMRLRKELSEEKQKMLDSGWLDEELPFPEALDDDGDVVTLEELEAQERSVLEHMRASVMGGDEGSHERIRRQRKALKDIKAQKALMRLNSVHKRPLPDIKGEESPACNAPVATDFEPYNALNAAPVYNDGSAAVREFNDMEDDVIVQMTQNESQGLWQGAAPRTKGGQRVGASLEQRWRHWT